MITSWTVPAKLRGKLVLPPNPPNPLFIGRIEGHTTGHPRVLLSVAMGPIVAISNGWMRPEEPIIHLLGQWQTLPYGRLQQIPQAVDEGLWILDRVCRTIGLPPLAGYDAVFERVTRSLLEVQHADPIELP
jgi:hypothetical protein